ncbi:hypothetical protein QR680_007436 [Steinernema hermaphroditum]|uniref:Serpentine receptor class gamma n=1 Tax=Steinernema hermaphroditum TaxID=289476 RepID=A0AA39ID84_9BILA|nr:hypothetical protein QR680_007436 [Steinernema hermaphroditum]
MRGEVGILVVSLLYGIPSFLLYVIVLFQLIRPMYRSRFNNPFFRLCFVIGVVDCFGYLTFYFFFKLPMFSIASSIYGSPFFSSLAFTTSIHFSLFVISGLEERVDVKCQCSRPDNSISLCRVRDCAWTAVVGGRGIPEPILKTDPSQESDRGERLEDRKKKMAMDLKELKDEMQKLGQSFEKKNSEDATRNLDLYPSYLGTKVGAALGHSYDKMAVILPLTSTSQLTPRKEDELRRLIEQADRLEEQHRKLTSDFDRDSTRIEYQLLRNVCPPCLRQSNSLTDQIFVPTTGDEKTSDPPITPKKRCPLFFKRYNPFLR